MLHLVKLELKKHKLRSAWYTLVIASVAILGFVLLIGHAEEGQAFTDYAHALSIIEFMVNATFVIHASVLLSRFVVEEYRSHTISILFTYPISRKKLLTAKLLIVSTLTFALIIAATVLVTIGFYYCNEQWPLVPDELTAELAARQALQLVVNAAAFSCLALIPLFFGMLRKSVPATIVSSIVLTGILNTGESTLSSVIAVPIALGLVGIFIAYLSIRNVEVVDI